MEQLEPVRRKDRRESRGRDRRGHGLIRDARRRVPLRRHRRWLDGARARSQWRLRRRPRQVPEGDEDVVGSHTRARAALRHLHRRGHEDVSGPTGEPRLRVPRRAAVRRVGRGLRQGRLVPHRRPGAAGALREVGAGASCGSAPNRAFDLRMGPCTPVGMGRRARSPLAHELGHSAGVVEHRHHPRPSGGAPPVRRTRSLERSGHARSRQR